LKNFCFHNFVFPGCDIRPARPSCSRQTDVVLSPKAEIPAKTRHDYANYFFAGGKSSSARFQNVFVEEFNEMELAEDLRAAGYTVTGGK
jgi:hypothetical protein